MRPELARVCDRLRTAECARAGSQTTVNRELRKDMNSLTSCSYEIIKASDYFKNMRNRTLEDSHQGDHPIRET